MRNHLARWVVVAAVVGGFRSGSTTTTPAAAAAPDYVTPAREIAARAATRPAAGRSGGDLAAPGVVLSTEELGRGVPGWARESLPAWVEPFVGRQGMLPPRNAKKGILAPGVAGLDRWQANRFVNYRPETAEYLYTAYTPLEARYTRGTFPALELVVARHAPRRGTDTEKALALLTGAMPDLPHPSIVPKGAPVKADRDLTDEQLYLSRSAWCNEQARVFVTLCRIAGVPARIVHLFYSDTTTGHTVAEFHADGAWHMADASYGVVFRGKGGGLMSAAECHLAANRPFVEAAYRERFRAVAAMPDERLGGPEQAARFRAAAETAWRYPASLDAFAVINHPCPP